MIVARGNGCRTVLVWWQRRIVACGGRSSLWPWLPPCPASSPPLWLRPSHPAPTSATTHHRPPPADSHFGCFQTPTHTTQRQTTPVPLAESPPFPPLHLVRPSSLARAIALSISLFLFIASRRPRRLPRPRWRASTQMSTPTCPAATGTTTVSTSVRFARMPCSSLVDVDRGDCLC